MSIRRIFPAITLNKKNSNPLVSADFGYGEVLRTGRVNTKKLQDLYIKYLADSGKIKNEQFLHHEINFLDDCIAYKNIKAKNIVFAEGFGLKKNPFFNFLPLNGTKGELLTIRSPSLQLDFVLKSSVFIIPLGNDLYKIGATYKWKDKDWMKKRKKEFLSHFSPPRKKGEARGWGSLRYTGSLKIITALSTSIAKRGLAALFIFTCRLRLKWCVRRQRRIRTSYREAVTCCW